MARVTAPVKGFVGKVVGAIFDDGIATVEDEQQLAYFRRHGYTVEETAAPESDPGPFDPAKHSVAEVTAYLDGLDAADKVTHDAEVARVLEAERKGKNRSTLVGAPQGDVLPPADPAAGNADNPPAPPAA